MDSSKACSSCGKEFWIFRWERECTECGEKICADCSLINRYLNRRVCNDCSRRLRDAISSIIVVKSDHVGGHNIKEYFDIVEGESWERDQEDTVDNIRYQAYKLGANALISLHIRKDTGSEPGSGKGTHYYSIFLASAQPVVISKVNKRREALGAGVAGELEKLVALKEKGLLTEQEFEKAKKKIFE